jgi:hypothetical protein
MPGMTTLRVRAVRSPHARRSPPRPRRVASLLVVALVGILGATACAFGLRGSRADASVEIRNTADIGVNMYMLPRTGLNEVFLGQVGPKSNRRVRIPRVAAGDTVWLRARPIDGRPEYVRNDIVLGRKTVWQIP